MKDMIPSPKDLPESGTFFKTSIKDFIVLWAKLCAAFPRTEVGKETLKVYHESLCVYEPGSVSESIEQCLRDCQYFPTIAEIVKKIKSPPGCIHHLKLAEIRSRETLLIEAEKHSDQKLQAIAKEVSRLQAEREEHFKRRAVWIEKNGIPQAEAKLRAVNDKILEQERVLELLRAKVKLMDQARILQDEETTH